jgi:integrase
MPSATIAPKTATIDQVWAEYQKRTQSVTVRGLAYLADQYYLSNAFLTLQPRTQDDYRSICSKKPLVAFESWQAGQIEPADLNEYLERRGKKSIRRANLELVWFKNVFGNAARTGLIKDNPTRDLKSLRLTRTEKKAQRNKYRYVSDADYKTMHQAASDTVKVAMEISYCTGCRLGDVLKIRWDDIEEAIFIDEGKTGREYNKALSPRLRAALAAAKDLPGHRFGGWVVRTRAGTRYTVSGFESRWTTARNKIEAPKRFTFHEIRKKATADAKGDKQKFTMHRDASMLRIYDLSVEMSPSN